MDGSQIPQIRLEDLLKSGVHFGHTTRNWCPKMRPYVYGLKQKVHLIDLQKTLTCLRGAQKALMQVAERGGRILFVSTKRVASQPLKEAALACGQFYINKRWLGGTLTNWKTVRKSIKKLKELSKKRETGLFELLKKKEALANERELTKLEARFGGIQNLNGLPDLLFIIDVEKEKVATLEARKTGIPVVAVVDTNASPEGIAYPIPGNDDGAAAIQLYLKAAIEAIQQGLETRRMRASALPGGRDLASSLGKIMSNSVTIEAIKSLRAESGAGIGECKKALQEAEGDLSRAREVLRKLAAVLAEKKASRPTPEGRISAAVDEASSRVALVSLSCETDFVGRNEEFQAAAEELARQGVHLGSEAKGLETLRGHFEHRRLSLIQKMGENIRLSALVGFEAPVIRIYAQQTGRRCAAVGFRVLNEPQEAVASGLAMSLAFVPGGPALAWAEGQAKGLQGGEGAQSSSEFSGLIEGFLTLEGAPLKSVLEANGLELVAFARLSIVGAEMESAQTGFVSEVQKLVQQYSEAP